MTATELLEWLSSSRWRFPCRIVWRVLHSISRKPVHVVNRDLSRRSFEGYNLRNVIFERCDLSAASLDRADLAGAAFHSCDLSLASFHDSDLSGVVVKHSNLRGAYLRWTCLRNADLSEADLFGGSLSNSDLTKAKLCGVDLRFVDLCRACIRECDFQGAMLPRPGTGSMYGSFLDLLSCDGLEDAIFDEPMYPTRYLVEAAAYARTAHAIELAWEPSFRRAVAILRDRKIWQDGEQAYDSGREYGLSQLTPEVMLSIRKTPAMLYELRSRSFEELAAELLAARGCWVQLSPPSNDGGFDIYALESDGSLRSSKRVVVECKRYSRERKAGVALVRSLCGTKERYNADRAVLITTASFTRGAIEFARSRDESDIVLIDGHGVEEMLASYVPRPNGRLYSYDSPYLREAQAAPAHQLGAQPPASIVLGPCFELAG